MVFAIARKGLIVKTYSRRPKGQASVVSTCGGASYKKVVVTIEQAHSQLAYMREHGWEIDGSVRPYPRPCAGGALVQEVEVQDA